MALRNSSRPDADKIPAFEEWLKGQGAEIRPPTNEYEVLRFACPAGVGVIYCNRKGRHTFNGRMAVEAWRCFRSGDPWRGKLRPTKRSAGSESKRALLLRDGENCFYCGEPLYDDITEEHLLPVNHGGSNHLANKVLCHQKCNSMAGHKTIYEKVLLREQLQGMTPRERTDGETTR